MYQVWWRWKGQRKRHLWGEKEEGLLVAKYREQHLRTYNSRGGRRLFWIERVGNPNEAVPVFDGKWKEVE